MVYFIRATSGGLIKIGTTANIDARLRQLEAQYECKLCVLRILAGFEVAERVMHARFDHLRYDGIGNRGARPELFIPGRDLMSFIGRPLFATSDAAWLDYVEEGLKDPRIVHIDVDRWRFSMDRGLLARARCVAEDRGVRVAGYLGSIPGHEVGRDFSDLIERDFNEVFAKTLKMKRDPEGYGSTFTHAAERLAKK